MLTHSLIKSTISQELRVAQKKNSWAENHRQMTQINPHLPCKLGHLWIVTSLATITQKLKIGKIWYMIFYLFQYIAHLLCRYVHFRGGREFLPVFNKKKLSRKNLKFLQYKVIQSILGYLLLCQFPPSSLTTLAKFPPGQLTPFVILFLYGTILREEGGGGGGVQNLN